MCTGLPGARRGEGSARRKEQDSSLLRRPGRLRYHGSVRLLFAMPKDSKPKQQQIRARIAAAAARIMAEDGIEDFALAKRKAARQLGAAEREGLPGNEEIEAELRAYRALYQADEHPERIAELRRVALEAMRALERFTPYL